MGRIWPKRGLTQYENNYLEHRLGEGGLKFFWPRGLGRLGPQQSLILGGLLRLGPK